MPPRGDTARGVDAVTRRRLHEPPPTRRQGPVTRTPDVRPPGSRRRGRPPGGMDPPLPGALCKEAPDIRHFVRPRTICGTLGVSHAGSGGRPAGGGRGCGRRGESLRAPLESRIGEAVARGAPGRATTRRGLGHPGRGESSGRTISTATASSRVGLASHFTIAGTGPIRQGGAAARSAASRPPSTGSADEATGPGSRWPSPSRTRPQEAVPRRAGPSVPAAAPLGAAARHTMCCPPRPSRPGIPLP